MTLPFLGFLVASYGGYLVVSGIRLFIAHRDLRFSRAAHSSGIVRIDSSLSPVKMRQASPQSDDFTRAGPGTRIRFRHPDRGELSGRVVGTIHYRELWQRRKSPSEPWVPTGNLFTAHWLGDMLLYTWKEGVWVLDVCEPITDAGIKTTFLPAAHRFGESDETAAVNFAYPPGSWRITDIGKFEVSETVGTGLRLSRGAVGRFIHAAGDTGLEGQALVVEDFLDGAGGQDTVWKGWKIDRSALLEIKG